MVVTECSRRWTDTRWATGARPGRLGFENCLFSQVFVPHYATPCLVWLQLVLRVEESEEEFEKISAFIKKELELVDEARFEEYKAAAVGYFSTMLQVQEKVGSLLFCVSTILKLFLCRS